MSKICLVRHGQSHWNLANKFTGSIDIALTDEGRNEASQISALLADISIDKVFASDLVRAKETAMIALPSYMPIIDSRLNERSYGDLQGMNKDQACQKFGKDQVYKWRRGYYDRPPNGESLFDTVVRVKEFIAENINEQENIAIFAHGNSIRALHMLFLNISPTEIIDFEVATGSLQIYQLRSNNFEKLS